MIEAVLFDLDDTLYPEEEFVRSGFRAVGRELESRGLCSGARASELFVTIHKGEGRDAVLDKGLRRLGLSPTLASELVATYRAHDPVQLTLFPGVSELLRRLRMVVKVGVVTDGWLGVQKRKVAALGLEDQVDAVFCSDELGRALWKPDPAPFLGCLDRLGGVKPERAVFVGDNPARDVAGALAAGLRPVLLRTDQGCFRSEPVPVDVVQLMDLSGLPELLGSWSLELQ